MNFLYSIIAFGFCAIAFPAFAMETKSKDIREIVSNDASIGGSRSDTFDIPESEEGDCSKFLSSDDDFMSQYLPHLGWNDGHSANYLEKYYRHTTTNPDQNYDDFLIQTIWDELRCARPLSRNEFELRIEKDATFLYVMEMSLGKEYFLTVSNYTIYINYDEFLYYYYQTTLACDHQYLDPVTFSQKFNDSTKETPLIIKCNQRYFKLAKDKITNYQDYINFLLSKTRKINSDRRSSRKDKITLDLMVMVKDNENEKTIS
jgi:hypothetical protein